MKLLALCCALLALASIGARAQCDPDPDPAMLTPPNQVTDPKGPPTKVYIKVFILSITKVDGVAQVFNADFYLSMYWYDPRLASVNYTNFDFTFDPKYYWTPLHEFKNVVGSPTAAVPDGDPFSILLNPYDYIEQPDPDNKAYVEFDQRLLGQFKTPLQLQEFPFDSQSVTMEVESVLFDNTDVIWEHAAQEEDKQILNQDFEVVEWDVLGAEANITETYYPTFEQTYSTFTVSVNLRRQPGYYMNKMVSGCVMLVYMSIMIFMLDVEEADRMMGTLTVFLALVAFVFVNGDNLPKVAYQTRIDDFMFFSFLLVFIEMGLHAIFYFWRGEKNQKGDGKTCCNGICPTFSALATWRKLDVITAVVLTIVYSAGTAGTLAS